MGKDPATLSQMSPKKKRIWTPICVVVKCGGSGTWMRGYKVIHLKSLNLRVKWV